MRDRRQRIRLFLQIVLDEFNPLQIIRRVLRVYRFSRYLVTTQRKPPRQDSERVIIMVCDSHAEKPGFSLELYEYISSLARLSNDLWIEHLAVLPVLSLSVPSEPATQQVLRTLLGSKDRFRFVGAVGGVEFGELGSDQRIDFGSCGDIVAEVAEALFSLPLDRSWGDEYLCGLVGGSPVAGVKVRGTTFFPIGSGPS